MARSRKFVSPASAFTLLEIIIVLAVAAVLIGLCIPFISGMIQEARMREPLRELQGLAKSMRARAMAERVSYEIAFTPEGFSGGRHSHYAGDSELLNARDGTHGEMETQITGTSSTAAEDAPDDPPPVVFAASYSMPEDMSCRVMFWGGDQWIELGEEGYSEPVRWVFQPSGLCNPIRVQFQKTSAWIEAAFHPLTADIQEERYFFPN